MNKLEQAIALAEQSHRGQMDEDGMPHIVHCMEVMLAVKKEFETTTYDIVKKASRTYTLEELMIAAILHDTVEDTAVTLEEITAFFGSKVATVVDCLSRRGKGNEKETYRDFIYRTRHNSGARLIKLADLHHNFGRTGTIPDAKKKWREKLQYKYGIAIKVLNFDDQSWEQASWHVSYEAETPHFFVADPNGKQIEVSKDEFDTLTKK